MYPTQAVKGSSPGSKGQQGKREEWRGLTPSSRAPVSTLEDEIREIQPVEHIPVSLFVETVELPGWVTQIYPPKGLRDFCSLSSVFVVIVVFEVSLK